MENLPESPFSKSTLISSSSLCNISSPPMDMQKNPHDLDGLTANQLVLLLLDGNLREEVMHELIKKRDTCEDLAPLLWNTSNAVYMLLMEVISVYWKLSPPMISMKKSTRACNALALFQVMAKNPETRKELIGAKIPCYFYPFLKPSGDDKPLEYLRLTSLGVLGALAKFDDPYGPKVLHFFLETEVVPSCLECMDLCDELSRKVATLIVMKILMQEKGMSYCSATPERFYSIVQVLYRVVQKLTEKPCLLHLMYVIQCFLSLSDVFKFIGPSEAFIRQVPPQLFDNTFKDILRDDHETAWMLQVLHFNVYGRLFSPE
ncbi:cell differentiation protein rcd1-like [Solanum verrucosum]|uniref:cell differentiation protein rcd1-like n=1 Tax=Solanum verrucosum TaxID=315347 RepID=UPI0020D158C4|nr:cell differentiation protein rcd1-like [Solanum verrucosum]